jgi:peroxiredoxin Q/BCP
MEAYRDQYATLFNGGKGVAVIAISVDPDTTLANWAREQGFPVVFASDTTGAVGAKYNAYDVQRKLDNRSLFVIGPDGKVTYVTRPFNVLSQQAYADLASAVQKTAPKASSGGGR